MVELKDDLVDEEFLFSDSKYVVKILCVHVSEGYGTLFVRVPVCLLPHCLPPRTTNWQKLIPISSMLHWLIFKFGKNTSFKNFFIDEQSEPTYLVVLMREFSVFGGHCTYCNVLRDSKYM